MGYLISVLFHLKNEKSNSQQIDKENLCYNFLFLYSSKHSYTYNHVKLIIRIRHRPH